MSEQLNQNIDQFVDLICQMAECNGIINKDFIKIGIKDLINQGIAEDQLHRNIFITNNSNDSNLIE